MGYFVGIDIGKGKHDYAIVDEAGGVLRTGFFASTSVGFEKLKEVLIQFDIILIGMEATGHYWRNLWQVLTGHEYACSLLNPASTVYFRRMTLIKHKTDALDAICIARYLATIRPDAQRLDIADQEALRSLARAQATLAEQITESVNRLHKQLDLSFPEFPKLVGRLDSPKTLMLLESYPTANMMARSRTLAQKRYGQQNHRIGNALAKRLKEAAGNTFGCAQGEVDALLIRQSVQLIKVLHGQAKALITEMEQLVNEQHQDAENLLSIPGIAIKSAAVVMGEIGDIQRFETAKKLTGYIGAHPRFHESGNKSAHPRMSKAGNKRLRRILWQCTIVAMRYNPIIKAYYEKKLAEGKKKMVAIGHCMNKLIHIIWAVLTYHENFDFNGGIRLQKVRKNGV
ncbi:MAG: IS110 family transposase [Mariprofundaceae bacterium]|nr:IS110 family transposase [Mariprofundaceae bacterium]